MTKVVILGLGAAGFGAALAAKKQDRTAEIIIIDNFTIMDQNYSIRIISFPAFASR